MADLNQNYLNSANVAVLGTENPSDIGQIFSYNGNNVTMRMKNGTVYVNLTEFAKPFPDKNLSTIINSKEINEYCESLSKLKNFSLADLLIVTRGGNMPGTWAHQKVAIRVAQKLSTDFAIWVDDKIEELLTTGSASLQPKLPNFNNPAESARAWADQYERNKMLTLEVQKKEAENEQNRHIIESQQKQIESLRPKATFADCFLRQKGDITIKDLTLYLNEANLFSMGYNKLKEWMRLNGYLMKRGKDKNKPTQKSMDKKLLRLIFVSYSKKEVYVTSKGKMYFIMTFRRLHEGKKECRLNF